MKKGWRYVIVPIALQVIAGMRRSCKLCGRVGVENAAGTLRCKRDDSEWK